MFSCKTQGALDGERRAWRVWAGWIARDQMEDIIHDEMCESRRGGCQSLAKALRIVGKGKET